MIGTLLTQREAEPDLADDALVATTAEMIGLSRSQVRIAVRYHAAYPAEIDDWITSNRELAARIEEQWLAEHKLLRGKTRAS